MELVSLPLDSKRNGKLFRFAASAFARALAGSPPPATLCHRSAKDGRLAPRSGKGNRLNIETAQATRLGNRRENQDRAAILIADTQVLLVVADGMGAMPMARSRPRRPWIL
jgi:hypothetical protein